MPTSYRAYLSLLRTSLRHRVIVLCSALLLLLLPSAGCGDDTGTPSGPVTFTLATWNVRNFFDAENDPLKVDDVPTVGELGNKLNEVSSALRVLAADIVVLQEVENKPLLELLNNSRLKDSGYKTVELVEGNDPRGIDVGLLSRYPIKRLQTHVDDKFPGVDGDTATYSFSRDCLEVELDVGGRSVVLLINHLRSESTSSGDGTARRAAQAAQVRKIADGLLGQNPNALLAVVGDLNDDPTSRPLQLLRDGSPALFDILTLRPAAERYTASWSGKPQVDFQLLSPAMRATLADDTARALHTSIFSKTSDHYPVIASYTLP